MTEREAIEFIKYQICSEQYFPHICKDECLYGRDKCSYSLAIEALEKQISKKPHLERNRIDAAWECPICHSFVGYLVDNKDALRRNKHCVNCGQKLDWSGDNETD